MRLFTLALPLLLLVAQAKELPGPAAENYPGATNATSPPSGETPPAPPPDPVAYVGYDLNGDALPGSCGVGDFILVQLFNFGATSSYSGWTKITGRSNIGGSGYDLDWVWRVWQMGDSLPSWSEGLPELWCYTNTDPTTPIYDQAVSQGDATTRTLTSITARADGDLALYANGGVGFGSLGTPSGYTERSDSTFDTSAGEKAALDADESTSGSFSGSGYEWVLLHIILTVDDG